MLVIFVTVHAYVRIRRCINYFVTGNATLGARERNKSTVSDSHARASQAGSYTLRTHWALGIDLYLFIGMEFTDFAKPPMQQITAANLTTPYICGVRCVS